MTVAFKFPTLEIQRKTGEERFHASGEVRPEAPCLLDFWRWSSSDLTNNAARGLIAEWLVGHALGLVSTAREEWASVDFVMDNEKRTKIEVKSSSPWQTWDQHERSNIIFQIGPTVGQKPEAKARRQSDLYVFCVLDCKEKTQLDPLNTDQWRFFAIGEVRGDRDTV